MKKRLLSVFLLAVIVAFGIYGATLDLQALVSNTSITARMLFFLLVVTEVVIAPIPGGIIAFLGAAAWGFWISWPIHYLGNVVGGVLAFSLARSLGRPFVEKHTNKKLRARYEKWLKNNPVLVWLVYAIPVFPIDALSLILGASSMRLRRYVITIATALPFYTGIVAYIGATYGSNLPFLEYVGLAMFVLFGAALVYLGVKLWK